MFSSQNVESLFFKDEKFVMQQLIEKKKESLILSDGQLRLAEEFFNDCKNENLTQEKYLSNYQKYPNFLRMKDRREKTGLDYLCSYQKPPLDLIFSFIEKWDDIVPVVPHIESLIYRAIIENHNRIVLFLLEHAIKSENIFKKICFFSNSEGQDIEKLIYLLESVDKNTQANIILTAKKRMLENQDADEILCDILKQYQTQLVKDVLSMEHDFQFHFELNDEKENSFVNPSDGPMELACSENENIPLMKFSLYKEKNVRKLENEVEINSKLNFD